MVNIIEKLSTNNCYLNRNNPQYITIHETDNINRGAGALAHANAQFNGNLDTSVHYYVDDKVIYKCLDHNHGAWAVGGGNKGIYNTNTINIEICVNPDSDYNTAVTNCIDLVRYLKSGYYSNCQVVRHYDATGKWCPRRILNNNYWNTFLNRVNNKESVSTPPVSSPEQITEFNAIAIKPCVGYSNGTKTGELYNLERCNIISVSGDGKYDRTVKFNGLINNQPVIKEAIFKSDEVKLIKDVYNYYNSEVGNVQVSDYNGNPVGVLYPNESCYVNAIDSNGKALIAFDTATSQKHIPLGKTGYVDISHLSKIGEEVVEEKKVNVLIENIGKGNAEKLLKDLEEKGIKGIIKEEQL